MRLKSQDLVSETLGPRHGAVQDAGWGTRGLQPYIAGYGGMLRYQELDASAVFPLILDDS